MEAEVVEQDLSSGFSIDNDDGQLKTSLLDTKDISYGITLSLRDINCNVDGLTRTKIPTQLPSFCRPTSSKQILFNLSGNFKPGMNAILGMISVKTICFNV